MEEKMVIENESTEVVEVEETKTGSKVGGFFKRHGKKIVAGAAVVAAYVIGTVVGKKKAGCSGDYEDDYIEADFSEVDTNE